MKAIEHVERGVEVERSEARSRLIIVSNREPYEHRLRQGHRVCERTDGGLASALDPVLKRVGGVWVAWGSGQADREATGADDRLAVPPEAPAYYLRRVWLTEDETQGGYQGYANEVLWPLCHVTLDRVAYRKRYWDAYVALNRRFGAAVAQELQAGSGLVWVHDFHLALLPAFIKERNPNAVVAFFWHVPWPGPDVFRILPERQAVVGALLQADSLVFQTPGYARAFQESARQFLDAGMEAGSGTVVYKGHRTRITARGISIDFDAFSTRARRPQIEQTMASLRRQIGLRPGVKVGVGVDRLDYTKGLLKRLWALDHFFQRHPGYRGRFTFIQLAVPTRREMETYRRYRKHIWQTVFEINDRYRLAEGPAVQRWQPIVYLEDRFNADVLAAYYRLADLALVSSVNDGMNLVAKEYVASQVDERGVLLISQMAGAAEELREALIINPYDSEGLADSIKEALEMPEDERRRRMRVMREYLRDHDVHAWVDDCLNDAAAAVAGGGSVVDGAATASAVAPPAERA
ncbi:alpha,alpha-trehalose-phosphate synthase (UDP-forming) [Candidatus Nitrospira bockiana]